MKRAWITWCAVAGLARAAAAQAQAPAELVTASWLERAVAEQLMADGIALSRRGFALQIEQADTSWLVSLVDVTTGRVAASSEIDALPADREAAVSAVAHAVAELAAQVGGRAEPPPSPAALAGPTDAELRRARREATELRFKRRSIRFEPSDPGAQPRTRLPEWLFLRGELDQPLDAPAFYRLVGRDDLAWAYHRRHGLMIGSYVLAAAALTVAGVLFAANDDPFCEVELTPDGHGQCLRIRHPSSAASAWILLGVGVTGALVGTYFSTRPQPIDVDDARALADAYNQRLRRRLGLPPAPRHARLRDVTLTPYVTGHDTGLVVGARF
jgi:hypothetical protein